MTVSRRTLLKVTCLLALTATTLAGSLYAMWLALRSWLGLPLDLSLALILFTGLVSILAAIYGVATWPASLDASNPEAGAATLHAGLMLLGFAATVVAPMGLAMHGLRNGHSTLTLFLVIAAVAWLVVGSRLILPRVMAADPRPPGQAAAPRFEQRFRVCVFLLPLLLTVSLALTFLTIHRDRELAVLFTAMALLYGPWAWRRLRV